MIFGKTQLVGTPLLCTDGRTADEVRLIKIAQSLQIRGESFLAQVLCNGHGHQLRDAMRVLQGFDRVFCGEPAHEQRKLGIGCHVDRSGINSLNVLGGAATSVQFYNKFDVFHFLRPFGENGEQSGNSFL